MGFLNPVNFQLPAGGGSFPATLDITDPNESVRVPTGLILIVSGATTSLDARNATSRMSVGFFDLTNQYAVGHSSEHNDSAANAHSSVRADNATVVQMLGDTGGTALMVEAYVSSVAAGKVTLTVDAGSNFYGTAVFVYEAQKVVAEAVTPSSSIGGTANSSDHGMGRQPDLVFAASVGIAPTADNSSSGGFFSMGAIARGATQGCVSRINEDASNPTSSGGVLRDDYIIRKIASGITAGAGLEISLTTSGFTITTRDVAESVPAIFLSLYLSEAPVWSGTQTIAASTGGTKSITAPGFQARTVLAFAFRTTAANNLSNVQDAVSFGAGTLDEQGLAGTWARDAQTTSDTGSVGSQSNLIALISGTSTFDWVADLSASISTGFEINVSDTAGGDRVVFFVAVGNPRKDRGWLAEFVARRARPLLWGRRE